ncbi:MAG: presenilin family intramembrane aspartyl protease [Candidatus Micrarchaeota archaeon]
MDRCTNRRTENTTTLNKNEIFDKDKKLDKKLDKKNEKYKIVLIFAHIILLFIAAQILGLHTGNFIIQDAKHNEIVKNMQIVSVSNEFSTFYIFFYVLLGTLIMYLIIKFYRGELLFILLEFAIISFSSSVVFYSFLRPMFLEFNAMVIAIALGLCFGFSKIAFPQLKNTAAVISAAGAGAVFGLSFNFHQALLFLVLLSIYDYIAVFKTKHMVKMAMVLSKRETAFLISSVQQSTRGEIRFELGTGDIIVPIILGVSGYQINLMYSIITFSASVFSLFVLFILIAKEKTVLSALPIIALCNFIFLGISKLLGWVG